MFKLQYFGLERWGGGGLKRNKSWTPFCLYFVPQVTPLPDSVGGETERSSHCKTPPTSFPAPLSLTLPPTAAHLSILSVRELLPTSPSVLMVSMWPDSGDEDDIKNGAGQFLYGDAIGLEGWVAQWNTSLTATFNIEQSGVNRGVLGPYEPTTGFPQVGKVAETDHMAHPVG